MIPPSPEWKLITDLTRNEELLFHLASDPGEQGKVNAKHVEKLTNMRTQLHDWISAMQEAAAGGPATAEVDSETLQMLEQLGYVGEENEDEEPEQ